MSTEQNYVAVRDFATLSEPLSQKALSTNPISKPISYVLRDFQDVRELVAMSASLRRWFTAYVLTDDSSVLSTEERNDCELHFLILNEFLDGRIEDAIVALEMRACGAANQTLIHPRNEMKQDNKANHCAEEGATA